jgi:hypothetical protein
MYYSQSFTCGRRLWEVDGTENCSILFKPVQNQRFSRENEGAGAKKVEKLFKGGREWLWQ